MVDAYLVGNLQESLTLDGKQLAEVLPLVQKLQADRREFYLSRARPAAAAAPPGLGHGHRSGGPRAAEAARDAREGRAGDGPPSPQGPRRGAHARPAGEVPGAGVRGGAAHAAADRTRGVPASAVSVSGLHRLVRLAEVGHPPRREDEGRARVVRFTRREQAAWAKIHEILVETEIEWRRALSARDFSRPKKLLCEVWTSDQVPSSVSLTDVALSGSPRWDRNFLSGAPETWPAASRGVAELNARRRVGHTSGADTFALSAQPPSFGGVDVRRDRPEAVANAGVVESGERPCRIHGGDRGCDHECGLCNEPDHAHLAAAARTHEPRTSPSSSCATSRSPCPRRASAAPTGCAWATS